MSLQKSSSSSLWADFKSITYGFVGWWALDVLFFFFWVVPLVIALGIGLFGVTSAYLLKMVKDWWAGQLTEYPWTGKKEDPWP